VKVSEGSIENRELKKNETLVELLVRESTGEDQGKQHVLRFKHLSGDASISFWLIKKVLEDGWVISESSTI
jgi:hypothetical protein